MLIILFHLELVAFTPLLQINRQIDRLQVGLTCYVTILD